MNRIKLALDEDNRYRWRKWSLSRYYGYISNPERFAKMGYAWARSGCMRDSMFLGQINRAESLVSLDDNMLHNDMLLAILSANNKYSSRQICQSILRRNPEDYNALLDMVGFELRDGNKMKAIEYLERVTKYSTDWLEATIELSIIALLKNNYDEAEKILEDAISYSSNNMKAWALLATVKMHRHNATKDKKTKNSILNNIETGILSKMKAYTKNHLDYYLLVTRAFFFTVKGETKRREACESFVKAVEKRSNCDVIYDLILKHSILLNDVKNGEFAASNIHQDNRKSPLASYVLGLAALQRGDSKSAEIFLRESADVFSHNGLVLNDLAEALRRNKKYSEAEHYALMAVHNDPRFYLPWVTLGSILMERKKEIEEAHKCIMKGYELSKKEKRMVTVNVLLSFINDYLKNSDKDNIVITIRKIQSLVYGSSKYDKL